MSRRVLPVAENRVKGTTRLGIGRWEDTPEFAEAAAAFRALGASAFTRHFKSRDEDPWPKQTWLDMINRARQRQVKIFAYYWHTAEATIAQDPDNEHWVCKDENGNVIVEKVKGDDEDDDDKGRIALDITGGYRQIVLNRLLLLAHLGIDGLMFDERHLPPTGCWGSALEDVWRGEMGEEPPPAVDDRDPRYRVYLDFKARRIEDTFLYWRNAVQARYPHVVFIVSTATIPALTDREMTTRLARISDHPKNEYRLALSHALSKRVFRDHPTLAPDNHVRQAVGWTVLRDASEGRPPHIWVKGVPNADHAKAAAASLLTFGCVANMDVDEQSLLGTLPPGPGKTPIDALEAAFALGRDASPHLVDTEPLRWAAVHFAERARNHRDNNHRAAWEQVLWPMVGAFQVLSEEGLPVGVVNDHQLEQGELAGYRLLMIPDREHLTPSQTRVVADFAAAGGTVVDNDRSWVWGDPGGRAAALAALRAVLLRHAATAPLRISGGPPGRYGVGYRKGGALVVAVTNDFSWVQITGRPEEDDETDVDSVVNPRPPPASRVKVAWRRGHGLPEKWDEIPFPRIRAIEAISRRTLDIGLDRGGNRVELPRFQEMALLVVSRST